MKRSAQIAGFCVLGSGLVFAYKSLHFRQDYFPSHIYNASNLKPIRWGLINSPSIQLYLERLKEAHNYCSGVEYHLWTLNEIFESTSTVTDKLHRLQQSFPILSQMTVPANAEELRETVLSILIARWEQLKMFSPHFKRIARDTEGRLVYGGDADCAPPSMMSSQPLLTPDSVGDAAKQLAEDGLVVLQGVVDPDLIKALRDAMSIKDNFMAKSRDRFETRSVDVEVIARGEEDAVFDDFVFARPHVLLRKTKYEDLIKPLYTAAMPLVWRAMAQQRKDSILTAATDASEDVHRVFISDIQLVSTHPCAAKKPWTADSGGGGLSLIIPLTPHNKKEHGYHQILPGSHRLRDGPLGWLHCLTRTMGYGGAVEWEPHAGDVVIADGRLMRRESPNRSFTLCEAYIIVRFDWSDRKPPGQNPVTSMIFNFLSGCIDGVGLVYKKLP